MAFTKAPRWIWWLPHWFYFVKLLNLPHSCNDCVRHLPGRQVRKGTQQKLLLPSSTNNYNLVYAISPKASSIFFAECVTALDHYFNNIHQ